jgi:hypothetical protein
VFDCSSDLFSPSLSATVGKVEMAKNFKPGILSFPFTNTEVRDLIDHFRFEAECFYPFIPFDSLTSLAAAIDGQGAIPNRSTSPASKEWDDKFDSRNLDLLRLVLACAIVSKSNRETEISRHMMSAASGHLAIKLNGLGLEFDTKDIVISALLVSFPIAMKYISMIDGVDLERLLLVMRRNYSSLEENWHCSEDVSGAWAS